MISRRQFLSKFALTGAAVVTKSAEAIASERCADATCETHECYTRMFPQLARLPSTPGSPLETGLKELGAKMRECGQDEGAVSAGYTYLGQFIDHDLTLDITPLELAHPSVERIPNFRTPLLDLDHVYARGPSLSPFLYEMNGPPGNERFLVGMTGHKKLKGRDLEPSPNDLPRNPKGIALAGDPRQDENLIIAQLHVAFLKFHNRVMEELDKGGKGKFQSVGPAGASRFEQARRLVTWHYQYIVLHDFLRALINQEVLKGVQEKCTAPTAATRSFQIPIEFSAAAFRFGHSMVRDVYDSYNQHHENVSLPCLLALTGFGSRNIACKDSSGSIVPFVLPEDWVIEWKHFFLFSPADVRLNDARKIDTNIANGLHELSIETVKQFNAAIQGAPPQLVSPSNKLPVRTLLRGARMGMPSGQEVAKALGLDPLHPDEIAPISSPHYDTLKNYGFDTDTPLWYYILKEAELKGSPNGGRLGLVGSRIVADVILGALRADPGSYLSVDPKWQPTLDLADILALVSDIH